MNRVGKMALRLSLARMKTSHQLPQFDWYDLAHALLSPTSLWHTDKLVRPLEGGFDGIIPFDTPIGVCAFRKSLPGALGAFVLEQMMHTYEHDAVVVKKDDIVVDWGAHVGTFSRYAFLQGAQTVIAFEPEPEHLRCLQLGFQKELDQGRMYVIPAAAWNTDTVVRFHSQLWMSRVSPDGELEVAARSLDSVVEELKLSRIDFIKADIEGAERNALQGACEAIRRFHPRMAICTYHLPDDPGVIPRIVKATYPYNVAFNISHDQVFFYPASCN